MHFWKEPLDSVILNVPPSKNAFLEPLQKKSFFEEKMCDTFQNRGFGELQFL